MPAGRKRKASTGEPSYRFHCDVCGQGYEERWALRKHEQTHMNKEDRQTYDCIEEGCGKTFLTASGLKNHRETHKSEEDRRKYECTVEGCGITFLTAGGLHQHMKKHAILEDPNRAYRCTVEGCGMSVRSQGALNAHLETHKSEEDRKMFPCTVEGCDKTYKSQSGLSQHLETHKSEEDRKKPHKCPEEGCEMSFFQSNHLHVHLETHKNREDRTEYPCTVEGCDSTFMRPESLYAHLRYHQDKDAGKIFDCPEDGCDATFTRRDSIPPHMKIFHSDTPILICEECGQSFKSTSNLNAHLQTHLSRENREEYVCEKEGCGKSFITKTGLQRHWDSKHSEEGSEERQAYLAYRARNEKIWSEKMAGKREKGLCTATAGCEMKSLAPFNKCLGHLSLIKPWNDALNKAKTENKSRQGAGHHVMTPGDMEDVLELGLSVKPKYDDLLRQVRYSLEDPEDPERLAFCVDVEGSSTACEAYEISVFKCDGTHVITTLVDWEIETRRLGSEGNAIDPKTLVKIYKGQQYTYGMKRTDIAEHLKAAGMNEHSTILMWGGTIDIRCLRGTLGDFMELPKTSLDCSMLWRSALPGLPCHQLSVVHSLCFPTSVLSSQRHRAEPDTRMLLALNQLFVENGE